MTPFEWIVGGGIIGMIGLLLVNNRAQDAKIERNYERLDETKEYQDKTFTRVDICVLTHKQITEKLDRIESKLDKVINGK